MIKAPIPSNEQERVAALRALKILDTPPEERFDRITRLAMQIFAVPICYVAMVDANRQWFKSNCGMPGKQTARDTSFCGHTILQDEALIIPDATQDPRFSDNDLVTGKPFVRFYAGHPLKAFGQNVGTLCLVDQKPRTPDANEIQMLKQLAAMVEHEIMLVDVIGVQSELIETKQKLLESQRQLSRELAEAAEYVQSLLPPPLNEEVSTAWRFEPSAELGGDLFGYHWVDDDHFAIYLLDVCGHGVGAALLSISLFNVLRGQALHGTDFRNPSSVLERLNEAFPMELNGNKYFTIWYGVYRKSKRRLTYASGGHPPAILFTGESYEHSSPLHLRTPGMIVGGMPGVEYECDTCKLGPWSRLYVFSDGVYEISRPDGSMLNLDELVEKLGQQTNGSDNSDVEDLHRFVREQRGGPELDDDFSLLRIDFTANGKGHEHTVAK